MKLSNNLIVLVALLTCTVSTEIITKAASVDTGNFSVTKLSQWSIAQTGPTKLQVHIKDGVLFLHWPGGPGQAVVTAKSQVPVKIFLSHPPRHPDRSYLRFTSQVNILSKQYGGRFLATLIPITQDGKAHTPYLMRSAYYGGTYGLGVDQLLYAPSGQWAKVDFNYPVSKRVVAVKPQFIFRGNAITVAIKSVGIRPGLVWKRGRPQAKPEDRKFDSKQVAKILAERKRAVPKLVKKAGRVALTVNGKDVFPACYTRGPHYPQYTRYGLFSKNGFNIIRIYASFGPFSKTHEMGVDNMWIGKDKYDFFELAHELKVIANINPHALVIVGAIMSPYHGWAKQHPDSIFRNAKGQKLVTNGGAPGHFGVKPNPDANTEQFYAPTFYAGAYLKDASNAVYHLAKFLQTSAVGKIVFSVEFLGGDDGQLYPWGMEIPTNRSANYSPVAIAAWHQYLRKIYHNDINLLRAAWHKNKVTFSDADIPSVHERGQSSSTITQNGIDYNNFLSYEMANFYISLGKSLKRGSDNRLLPGVYYIDSATQGIWSHTNANLLLNSPYIDTVRTVHRPQFAGSWWLHDKLIWDELDMRQPFPSSMQYITKGLVYPKSYFHTLLWRNAAMSVTNWRGGYYMYDLAESWYQKPAMIGYIGKVRSGLASAINDNVNIKTAVGVITDERVFPRLADHMDYRLTRTSSYNLYRACSHSGVTWTRYLLNDVLTPTFKLPKICILRLPMAMTPAQAEVLRDKARRDHSILIWGYGVGKVAQGQPGPQSVCGFTMRALRKLARKPIVVTGKSWAARGLGGQLLGAPPQPINYRLNLRWRGWPYAIQPEPGDVVLGVYPGTNKAGAVLRTRGGLTQIAIGRPGAISPQFIRNLAKHVGVTPFSTANDEIYFGSGIMAIYSGRGGKRTITLPKNMTVAGSPTGNSYSATPNGFTFEAGYNSEAIFKIVKRQ